MTDEGLYGTTGSETSKQVGVIEEEVVVGNLKFTNFWVISVEGGWSTARSASTFRGAMIVVAKLLKEGYEWIPNVHPSWLP